IPEALLQPRYPAAVRRIHHGLCALGTLVFEVFSTAFHTVPSPQVALLLGPVGTPVASLLAMLVMPVLWVRPARKLLKRLCTVASFLRSAAACVVVTGLAALWKWHAYPVK